MGIQKSIGIVIGIVIAVILINMIFPSFFQDLFYNPKPEFNFTTPTADIGVLVNGSCQIQISSTVKNQGDEVRDVLVSAYVMNLENKLLDELLVSIGGLGENESKRFNIDEIVSNEVCSSEVRVHLEVKRFK